MGLHNDILLHLSSFSLPSSVFFKGIRIGSWHRMRRHWTYRTKKIITHPFGLDLLALIFYTASAEASRGACKGYKNRGSSVMIGIRKFFLLLLLKWGTEHHHLVEASKHSGFENIKKSLPIWVASGSRKILNMASDLFNFFDRLIMKADDQALT